MNRPPDDDLRGLFDEARRADEEKAPPFRRVLERGSARRFATPRRIGRALAVGAASILIVISARMLHRSPPIPVGRIETWKPPTDFLLEAAFTELFDTIPELPKPVPDYSLLLAKEKGDKS
jgi:hypothetical protein